MSSSFTTLTYLRVGVRVLLQVHVMAKRFSADEAAKGSHDSVKPSDVEVESKRCGVSLKQSWSISGEM